MRGAGALAAIAAAWLAVAGIWIHGRLDYRKVQNQGTTVVSPFPNPLDGLLRPPQFDFATRELNYAELMLDPSARQITVRYFDADGAMFAELQYTL